MFQTVKNRHTHNVVFFSRNNGLLSRKYWRRPEGIVYEKHDVVEDNAIEKCVEIIFVRNGLIITTSITNKYTFAYIYKRRALAATVGRLTMWARWWAGSSVVRCWNRPSMIVGGERWIKEFEWWRQSRWHQKSERIYKGRFGWMGSDYIGRPQEWAI